MRERLSRLIARRRRIRGPGLLLVGAVVGFVVVLGTQLQPSDPESRLPDRYRLAALIQRQQQENEATRQQVNDLRAQLEQGRSSTIGARQELRSQDGAISQQRQVAGLTPVSGVGFVATLADSSLSSAPTGNNNDLVIHSQDVQAIVNGMWSAGATAISINGQRLVSTSAVLCVGNTLLINGTVHSPPYQVTAVGADRSAFTSDPLVERFQRDAERFSLRFSIGGEGRQEVPGYNGPITPKFAQAVS